MASATTTAGQPKVKRFGFNTWDSPWLNAKFIIGIILILLVVSVEFVGPQFWDVDLAYAASSPLNLPPMWVEYTDDLKALGFAEPSPDHPLGTESNGRDMLALAINATPRSLRVGLIAAAVGMGVGIILGFTAGFMGGWVDSIIRVITDAFITIPALAVLIVISAYVRQITAENMAYLLALFAWPGPTRLLRAQVLSMREQGYVKMARLSGASNISIMFKEMMPNLLPYLAASFTGNVSGAILAAAGLEALGLGPSRLPTLGTVIFHSIRSSAIIRGMWWWWGTPLIMFILIFSALFLITIGLDEIANPRLRGLSEK